MKRIYQYYPNGDLERVWESTAEAARTFAVDESSIRKAMKRRGSCMGNYFSKDKVSNYFYPHLENPNFPKILIFDIETAPLTAFIWQLKTRYVNTGMLEKANWWMMSWSAKWLFEEDVLSDVVTTEEVIAEDDSRILKSLWDLINDADIVISHNGINFDHKMLNMRWLINDFNPPAPYRVVDTYRATRSLFNFPSYKLDYLARILGVGQKLEHDGFSLWRKCLLGDQESLYLMSMYNNVDVTILEDLYLIIRPWIKNHPNLGIFMESETPVCRVCGSSNLTEMSGHDYTTNLSKYETLRCECGAINKRRTSKLPTTVRKSLLSGMPA